MTKFYLYTRLINRIKQLVAIITSFAMAATFFASHVSLTASTNQMSSSLLLLYLNYSKPSCPNAAIIPQNLAFKRKWRIKAIWKVPVSLCIFQRKSDSIFGTFYCDSLRAHRFQTSITSFFMGIWVSNYSPFHGFWQSFISIEVCRDCIPALASSCKKQLMGFFVWLLFFLKVKHIS